MCGILIAANTIRVYFYFMEPFDTALLVQSLVVIAGQGALLKLCVECAGARAAPKYFQLDAPWRHWWQWTDFGSYLVAWLLLHVAVGALCTLGAGSEAATSLVGILALGTEAVMGVPQLYQNAVRGSTAGLSTVLVVSWVAGDVFKAVTYVATAAPWQFMLCAVVQTVVDVSILVQVWWFRDAGVVTNRPKLPEGVSPAPDRD